jgi:hypothetical protein
MKTLGPLAAALTGVFIMLNMFGGIVSGIWLVVLGEWWAFALGILGVFVSHYAIGIALLPSLGLGVAAYGAIQRKYWRSGMLLGALSNLYIAALMTMWCIAVLAIFISQASSTSWFPLLIWSYGVATGPWAFLAQKDVQSGSDTGAATFTFFAQVAYLLVIVAIAFFSPTILQAALLFGGVMLVAALVNLISAWGDLAAERECGETVELAG